MPPRSGSRGATDLVRDPRREPPGDKLAPKAVVGRVSLYLRQLEAFQRQGQTTISSSQLGAALAINDAQVRKDLAFFGQFGYPGIGYRIEELIAALRRILGIDRDWPLALVGLGNLGRALLKYRGSAAGASTSSPCSTTTRRRSARSIDGLVVRAARRAGRGGPRAGHRAWRSCRVPADAAQRVADQIVACGILGILNFAPMPLIVPPSVNVVAVDLSVQLEHLAYKVQNTPGRDLARRLRRLSDRRPPAC